MLISGKSDNFISDITTIFNSVKTSPIINPFNLLNKRLDIRSVKLL